MDGAGNSSASIDAPVPSDILLLIGPVLIGGFFSWLLYGILIVQIYLYYITYTQDRILIKITVYGLFIVETFQTVVVVKMAWAWLVAGWGRQVALTELNWGYNFIPITSGIVSLWVQSFYIWRIYALGKGLLVWKVIVGLIMAISLTQSITSIYVGIRFFNILLTEMSTMSLPGGIWFGGSAICDTLIAVSMVYLLASAKGSDRAVSVPRTTEKLLNRLIRFTVASGAITALAMVVHIALYYSRPKTNLYTLTAVTISKLYTNSVLASLNSRRALAVRTSGPFIESLDASAPAGPHVHVSRHIEFSGPRESQSIGTEESENRDKVLARRTSTSSEFVMMDFSKSSSHA